MNRSNRGGLATLVCVCLLIQGLGGCDRPDLRPGPSQVHVQQSVNPNQLIAFKDPLTGLFISDVRDAQDHVVQFTTAGELVWTDGTHLSDHSAQGPGE